MWSFIMDHNTNGLVQGCSNSIANALELLQSCTKPSILYYHYGIDNNQCDAALLPSDT